MESKGVKNKTGHPHHQIRVAKSIPGETLVFLEIEVHCYTS